VCLILMKELSVLFVVIFVNRMLLYIDHSE